MSTAAAAATKGPSATRIAAVIGGALASVAAIVGMHTDEAVYVYSSNGDALKKNGVEFGWAPFSALWNKRVRGDANFLHTVFLHCSSALSEQNADITRLQFDRRFSGAPTAALLGNATWRGVEQRIYIVPRSAFRDLASHRLDDAARAALLEQYARM